MTRKTLSKKLIASTFNRNDNPNTIGHCWHCGKQLIFKNRGNTKKRGVWQVDHYPVPYRDIESQILIGITDVNDASNLVPSCMECNLSHKFEISRWYYCNNSQFPCKKTFFKKLFYIISLLYTLIITAFFIYCRYLK